LAADRLRKLAADLEAAAHTRDLTQLASLAEHIQAEMQRCLSEIPNIRAGSHAQ